MSCKVGAGNGQESPSSVWNSWGADGPGWLDCAPWDGGGAQAGPLGERVTQMRGSYGVGKAAGPGSCG